MINQKKYSFKSEFKKLCGMILLALVITWQAGIWFNLFIVGMILLFEHLIVYGRFDFYDFLGHEYLGLILVMIPLIKLGAWISLVIVVAAFLIACRYEWTEKLSPKDYALNKIKRIYND